jgi:hypothetical protein
MNIKLMDITIAVPAISFRHLAKRFLNPAPFLAGLFL